MAQTQKKGDSPRMTLAFYGDNMEFCREMAYGAHLSVTQYVNQLIEQEKKKHDPLAWKQSVKEELK